MSAIENEVDPGQGQAAPAQPSVRKVDPSFRRNMIIIGVVVAVVVLLAGLSLVLSSSKQKGGPAAGAVSITAPQSPVATDESRLSPEMRSAIAVKQREEAAKTSGVYLAPESLSDIKPLTPKGGASSPDAGPGPNPNPMLSNSNVSPQADPYYQETLARKREGMQRQMNSLIASLEVSEPVRVEFTRPDGASGAQAGIDAIAQATQAGMGSSTPAAGAAAASSPSQARPFVNGFELYAGESASPMDTYKTLYISAEINSGKLRGAFLVGTVKTNEEGAGMEFSGMRINGKTCRISARGLDEKTAMDALDVNVDRRYLERWVFPVLTAAVGAAATLKAQREQQIVGLGGTTADPNGTVGVNVGTATRGQVAAAAISGGVQILQREVDRSAAKPPQFTLPARSPIGIMFTAPVRESDCQ